MGLLQPSDGQLTISLGRLHDGQIKAYRALAPHRFAALRCGRRFGKTQLAKVWIATGIVRGETCGWFSPQFKQSFEVFAEMSRGPLAPLLTAASRGQGVMRFATGGRLDFWSLENPSAGRSRFYHRVVIDEAAFAKDSDSTAGSMMEIWEKSIKPTLYDYQGRALVASNSAGKNPDNFFYNICTDRKYGFHEYHARTIDNPLLPGRLSNETEEEWAARRARYHEEVRRTNAPLVYAQEHEAAFVDWSGEAFFDTKNLLVDGAPVPYPVHCHYVFAVIDTASKTGTEHDATAVTYFAHNKYSIAAPLTILDWDVVQIEGGMLETWLPRVLERLTELMKTCGARIDAPVAFIEDKNSGTILLQQARQRGLPAHAIESKLTALGKDERAINVSGYVFTGMVKYAQQAFDKTVVYKGRSANHLVAQVEGFRVGDKKSKREDDLLDTFCYGIAIALGNNEGF